MDGAEKTDFLGSRKEDEHRGLDVRLTQIRSIAIMAAQPIRSSQARP